MECTFVNAKSFKKTIEILKDLVQEICFCVTPAGISMASMDVSHVAFLRLMLPASSFSFYKVASDLLIGVKQAVLAKALSCVSEKTSLTLLYDGKSMELRTKEEGPLSREGTFPVEVIEVEPLDREPPEYPSHDVTFCLNAAVFQGDCEKLSGFKGDMILLTILSHEVRLALPSGGGMSETIMAQFQDPSLTSVTGTFALPYLQKFAKASSLCSTIQIGTSQDHPLYLVYSMEGGGSLTFILAPKIEVN